jgi:predicted nucleic acid-binding protein
VTTPKPSSNSPQVKADTPSAPSPAARYDAAALRNFANDLLLRLGVAPDIATDVADILAAIDLHRLHGFSFWDALVLRSAKQSGCSTLLSEDLQGNREIDGVRIVNPFSTSRM